MVVAGTKQLKCSIRSLQQRLKHKMAKTLEDIESAIALDPTNSTLYSQLIELLRNKSESCYSDKLKELRKSFIEQFPTSKEFWVEWVKEDRIDSEEQLLQWLSLVQKQHPDFNVILSLIDKGMQLYDNEIISADQLRSVFERAVLVCGTDIFTGSEIWKRYREFEIDEHEDLVEMQATATEQQKSKERFIKVYLRQLSLPLVGNEETLQEFESKLAEFCIESDFALVKPAELEKKIATAKEMREGRLIFEMHLFKDKYKSNSSTEKESFWMGYIEYEMKQNQLSRVQRLYERAVMEFPESMTIWLKFTDFALSTLKNWSLLSSVTKRALQLNNLKNSVFLWKLRLLSIECAGDASESIEYAFQRALASGLINVEEYLEIYLAHTDSKKRQLAVVLDKCKGGMGGNPVTGSVVAVDVEKVEKLRQSVTALREALEQVLAFLQAYGVDWVAGWWRLCRYQSHAEVSLLAPAEELLELSAAPVAQNDTSVEVPEMNFQSKKATQQSKKNLKPVVKLMPGSEIWEVVVKAFPSSYFLWSEYAAWAKNIGAMEHCRKIYRKMTNLSLDIPTMEICNEWVRFEQQYGNTADIQAALSRAFTHTASVLVVGSAASAPSQVSIEVTPATDGKRKRSDAEAVENATNSTVEVTVQQHPTAKKTKVDRPAASEAVAASSPPPSAIEVEVAPSKQDQPHPEVQLSDTTVVVSNFPFAASLDSIRPMILDKVAGIPKEEVQDAGAVPSSVQDVCLVLTKAGHSRGMVEVRFPVLSTEDNVSKDARMAFLALVAQVFHGYEYNNRCLKAEVLRPQAPKTPTSPTGAKSKADPLLAQKRAGSLAAPHLTTVFVSHFSADITSDQLRAHFAECGEILAAKVATDKKTGASKCTGLVQFATEQGRAEALKLNKSELQGAVIAVAPSRFSLIPVAAAASVATVNASSPTAGSKNRDSDHAASKGSPSTNNDRPSQQSKSHGDVPTTATDGTGHRNKPAPHSLARMSNLSFKPRNVPNSGPKSRLHL